MTSIENFRTVLANARKETDSCSRCFTTYLIPRLHDRANIEQTSSMAHLVFKTVSFC